MDEKIIPTPKTCKYCKNELKKDAKVCPYCGYHQNWIFRNILNITTLLSIAVVIISYLQFIAAQKDKNEASMARVLADSSLNNVKIALNQVDFMKKELKKTVIELQKQGLNITQVLFSDNKEYIQDFTMRIANCKLINSFIYEFDVLLKSKGPDFELNAYQCAINTNLKTILKDTVESSFEFIIGTSEITNLPNTYARISKTDQQYKLIFGSLIGEDKITNNEKRIGSFRIKCSNQLNNLVLRIDWNDTKLLGPSLSKFKKVNENIFVSSEKNKSGIETDIKIYLEGAFKNNDMSTNLNDQNIIPLSQSFNISPWNYLGSEKVQKIPNKIVDWILVELRTKKNASSMVIRRAAFLKSDGSIVDLDGKSKLLFEDISADNYYLVIKHRNHLPIMSSQPIFFANKADQYDFTVAKNKAFGSDPMKEINGRFCMIAGDADKNEEINVLDYNEISKSIFITGYKNGDCNMDGIVNIVDYTMPGKNILRKTEVPR